MAQQFSVMKLVAQILRFLATALESGVEVHTIQAMATIASIVPDASPGPATPSSDNADGAASPQAPEAPTAATDPPPPTSSPRTSATDAPTFAEHNTCIRACSLVYVTALNASNGTGKYHRMRICEGLWKAHAVRSAPECVASYHGHTKCKVCYDV